MLYHAPRAATVTCDQDDAAVWVVERHAFKQTLMKSNDQKMVRLLEEKLCGRFVVFGKKFSTTTSIIMIPPPQALYMRVFDNVDLFNVLTADEKASLAEVLVEVRYQNQDNIVVEGEPGDAFYILTEGKVEFLFVQRVNKISSPSSSRIFSHASLTLRKRCVGEDP